VRVSAHAFVADLERPVLEPTDRHHLERVLRLAPGDVVTVSDGAGAWRACRFGAELDPVSEVVVEPAPEPVVTIAFALVKGERPEWIVQKLTELGVDVIVAFRADRSVVRWDAARADRHRARLQTVAREAAMQSRRTRLPHVAPVTHLAELARLPGACLAERDGGPPSLARSTVLVGPEGGWSADERGLGLPTVGLGPHVLRAETAAVAAGVLLTALRAGSVRSDHAP
jgi:16S rRNA (uracil1498-N3)-methyltransferase